ncbi:MAG: ribonuclease P protein component [Anaerolineales bacterium]
MQPRFRLHRTSDIQRVRRTGKSYAHPLLVLVAARGEPPQRRVAFSAGKRVGGAVERNRAKRRLREAVRPLLSSLAEGWDLLLIARSGAVTADYADLAGAVRSLFQKAGVLDDDDQHPARAGG